MIVKNEERYISRCLSSVQDIADEIVIADTGSQDNTKDICKSFQARVFDFEWENDFAKARNYALQHAEGDWILVLDADEELDQETGRFLTSLLHDGLPSRGLLKIINYTGSSSMKTKRLKACSRDCSAIIKAFCIKAEFTRISRLPMRKKTMLFHAPMCDSSLRLLGAGRKDQAKT